MPRALLRTNALYNRAIYVTDLRSSDKTTEDTSILSVVSGYLSTWVNRPEPTGP
ncbi:MAG: hypothetical protein IPK60_20810 [Sandaracinaceae bacterium]|nr:hypothetical protein [Sandaracinaceae bacterium]